MIKYRVQHESLRLWLLKVYEGLRTFLDHLEAHRPFDMQEKQTLYLLLAAFLEDERKQNVL